MDAWTIVQLLMILSLIIFWLFVIVIRLIVNNDTAKKESGGKKKKKIFFISPVQTATPKNTMACEEYIAKLEKQGNVVFWPIRDNPHQKTDSIGITICDTNLEYLRAADEIHVWYLEESKGIHLDMGAAYILIRTIGLKKKIVFANRNEFNQELSQNWGKSFVKILDFLEKNT